MLTGGSSMPWWIDDYRGARWVRVDFHLHSPGVKSFACPNGLDPRNTEHRARIIDAYVRQLQEQGIKLAAITDYNGVREEWFVSIRDEAAKVGIVVLPGAELDFGASAAGKYGLHVLAVFDQKTDLDSINRVIHSLDRNTAKPLFDENGDHREIQPDGRVEDAIKKVVDTLSPSPIIIVAHPNGDKGLFKSMATSAQAEFINEVKPHALECFEDDDKNRLQSTGKIDRETLDRIACVEFSDPRAIGDIGTKPRSSDRLRATYLKLSTLDDINAVALALGDPEIMVRVSSAPDFPYTRLLAMEVEGSGFLGDMRIVWSPELINIIGGRGTGKSALIETVRYALDIPSFVETEYRAGLVRHSLGSGGKVSVWFEKQMGGAIRRRYRIQRIYGEKPRVFEISSDNNTETPVDLMPSDVVGADMIPLAFGQREIYSIATDPQKRIKLIDDVIGRAARDQRLEIQRRMEELRENAAGILQLRKALDKKEELETRLREISHEIELYQREGLASKLKEMTLLSTDEEMLCRIIEHTKGVEGALNTVEAEIEEYQREAAHLAAQAKSSCRDIVKSASTLADRLVDEIKILIATARNKVSAAIVVDFEQLDQKWKAARAPHDEAIRKVKQELGDQTLDPDRLDGLTREQTRISRQMDVLIKAEQDIETALMRRQQMLTDLRDARHALFNLRRQRADFLTARLQGQVKVAVKYRGSAAEYIERLGGLFSGSRVDRSSLEKLCSAVDMVEADGAYVAEVARKGESEFARQFNLTPNRAHQIVSWLLDDETRLLSLELLAPDDEIQISMVIDGSEIPVEKLSDGQKATAILMILLQQEDRPLVIDQPEDDLDNRFIYDGIVRILREQKGKRQIVAATHNPNIPVLGDAELILALGAKEGKCSVQNIGSIDKRDVREAVKKIMEGGEDAFRRRAMKYGAIDGGVTT